MTREAHVPPRPKFRGEPPNQAELVERHEHIRTGHEQRLSDVDRLARNQQDLGEALSDELRALQAQGEEVEALNVESGAGFLDGIVRRFTRRRQLLARRSATEHLVERYETVSGRLRRASAFTDELRLTALELQDEVQTLHREVDRATHDGRLSAERILALEASIESLDLADAEARERVLDTLRFELRQEGQNLELFETMAEMCRGHLPSARALRDTVQRLHEEMQSFVLAATSTVDAAGRRIQALGAAADAPIVVGELQQSLAELQDAMRATETTLAHTRRLIAHTLPELSSQIAAEAELEHLSLQSDLNKVDRAQAKAAAERALARAAWQEVEQVLDEGG